MGFLLLQPMNYDDAQHINNIIETEVKTTVAKLNAAAKGTGVDRSVKITYRLYTTGSSLVYNKVRFMFPRFMIYVEKGATRGRGGYKGSIWVNERGNKVSTNPKSFNKMNQGPSKAQEWFNPIIEEFVNNINNQLLNQFMSLSYKRLKIK